MYKGEVTLEKVHEAVGDCVPILKSSRFDQETA